MKLSTNKCNLLGSCIKYEQKWIKIGHDKKWQSTKSTVLDIKFVQSKFDMVFVIVFLKQQDI